MAERQCSACGTAAKYLRPETGYRCRACRAIPEPQTCTACGVQFTGRKRKYCGHRCGKRARDARFTSTERYRKRRNAKARKRRAADPRYAERQRERDRKRTRKPKTWERRLRDNCNTAAQRGREYWPFRLPDMGKERLRKAMLRRRIAAALHKRSKAANPNEYYRLRYRNDPTFMLWERHRNQFKKWMNGEKRTNTIARIVGYSREDLRQHIERQFDSGMSWENYGDWHIDHIVPKNLFDPANENHV